MRGLQGLLAIAVVVFAVGAAFAQDRPRVITFTKAHHYFAERLLGGSAEVVFPVPEGADPSFWRPSIADISMIQSADLILLNGAGFATWVDRVSLPRARVTNISSAIEDQFIVTESITHSHGDGGEHSHEGLASYIWLDPQLALSQAQAIASAVIARDLADQEDVEARLSKLRSDLNKLDAEVQETLGQYAGRTLIATHPRYQYFARRSGLTVSSLEWDAGAVPDEEDLAGLKALVATTGAGILIWEKQPPAEAFKRTEALGVRNVVFDPWARQNTRESYIRAYSSAISDLAAAIRQGSD